LSGRYSGYDFDNLGARPIVLPILKVAPRSNFLVTMTLHFSCNNRQKLIQHHWPTLMEKYGLHRDDRVEFDTQPRDGEPNEITVRTTLTGAFDHEAVAYCLARTERCRFKLGGPEGDVFQAERFPDHASFDGMFSISLTRQA
jgi:hypothetical protein